MDSALVFTAGPCCPFLQRLVHAGFSINLNWGTTGSQPGAVRVVAATWVEDKVPISVLCCSLTEYHRALTAHLLLIPLGCSGGLIARSDRFAQQRTGSLMGHLTLQQQISALEETARPLVPFACGSYWDILAEGTSSSPPPTFARTGNPDSHTYLRDDQAH